MASGKLDMYRLDTTPGANSMFAPPQWWNGDQEEYRIFMRQRYEHDIMLRQQIDVLTRRIALRAGVSNEITFSGPYSQTAKGMLKFLVGKYKRDLANSGQP